MKQLGEKWGIPTELTSYLVLEPGMQVPRRLDATRGVAGGVASAMPAPSAMAAERRESEFDRAKQAATMRESRSVGDMAAMNDATTRRTATRSFTLVDGTWVDARPAAANARVVTVRPFSTAYFTLMERITELREPFALGERVEIHGRAVTIRLAADGAAQLDEAALAAVTRDW